MTLAALTGSVRQEREHMFVPKYTEEEAREAVASSLCYSEALRKLGLRPHGGNFRLFRKYVDEIWHLPTGHFNPDAARVARVNTLQRPIPIADVLVEGSSYSRTKLKQSALRHRTENAKLRAMRPGRKLEGSQNVPDPRPHQRGSR